MTRSILALSLLLAVGSAACSGSLVVEKPKSSQLNDAMTEMWAQDIRRVARSGDWILTRSYSKTGDAVVGFTRGESFSHVAIYDAERDTIIEAIRPVVREVSLASFLGRNRYAVVVRPIGSSAQGGRETLRRARSVRGARFDYTGLVGLSHKSRFYCSELVSWASQLSNPPRVVTPADLYERGTLIYLSGARDERQVQLAARARQAHRRDRVASAR